MQPGCPRRTGTRASAAIPTKRAFSNALGLWHLRRGEFETAAEHFQAAIARLTALNPNPRGWRGVLQPGPGISVSGQDAKMRMTLSIRQRGTQPGRAPAYFALAECDASQADWAALVDHYNAALRADADNLNARNLLTIVLRKLGDIAAADRPSKRL